MAKRGVVGATHPGPIRNSDPPVCPGVQRLQPAQDLVAAVQQGVAAHAAEYCLFVGVVFNECLIQGLETFLEMIVILVLDNNRQGMQQTGQFFMLVDQVANLVVRIANLLLEKRIQHLVFHPHVQLEFVNECIDSCTASFHSRTPAAISQASSAAWCLL
jgi:hypothetical protein